MYNNHSNGASYGFKAPNIPGDAGKDTEVMFPTFELLKPTLSSNAAAVDVVRTTTAVDLGSNALAAAATLTAKPSSELPEGSRLIVKWVNGDTKYDVTVKKNSEDSGVALTGVQSIGVCYELVWLDSKWVLLK